MSRARASLAAIVTASLVAAALPASKAVATTLPETTYFYKVTLTENKLIVSPKASVKPGSLVVFTVRNMALRPRNLVFGNFKSGFMEPGKKKLFELNFLVPWSFVGFSVERGGGHRLAAKFICTW